VQKIARPNRPLGCY